MPTSGTLEFNPYLPEVHADPYRLYHPLAWRRWKVPAVQDFTESFAASGAQGIS